MTGVMRDNAAAHQRGPHVIAITRVSPTCLVAKRLQSGLTAAGKIQTRVCRREPHGVGVPSSLNVPRLMVPQTSRRIDGGWHEREKITSELQLSRVEEGKRGLNGVKGQNALTPQKGVWVIFIRYLDRARCRSWRHGVVANFTASRHRE